MTWFDSVTLSVYIFGGRNSTDIDLDTLWSYSPTNGRWSFIGGTLGGNVPPPVWPSSRSMGCAWTQDGLLWLYGGYTFLYAISKLTISVLLQAKRLAEIRTTCGCTILFRKFGNSWGEIQPYETSLLLITCQLVCEQFFFITLPLSLKAMLTDAFSRRVWPFRSSVAWFTKRIVYLDRS